MDRSIVYPGELPRSTDVLFPQVSSMIAIGKLASAIMGNGPWVHGFACTPTTPQSLTVTVGEGEIFSQVPVDASPYGSLPANPVLIVKQGFLFNPQSISLTPPASTGQSINYVIAAQYVEQDTNAQVLPYYNASNPQQGFYGPNNNGASQPTQRLCVAQLNVISGGAAPTGSQTTPVVTAGVGMWVVTVAYGQTQIGAANISVYPGAPFYNGPTTSSSSSNILLPLLLA